MTHWFWPFTSRAHNTHRKAKMHRTDGYNEWREQEIPPPDRPNYRIPTLREWSCAVQCAVQCNNNNNVVSPAISRQPRAHLIWLLADKAEHDPQL